MSRYIDADKLKKYCFQTEFGAFPKHEYFIKLQDLLEAPTADVEEVRHGKPIVYEAHGRYVTGAAVDETGTPFLMRKEYVEKRERCPFCNATLFGEWGYYCDKCGAKMDKEKENDAENSY